MSDTVQVHVNVDQIGPTASEGKAREHAIVMDRPESKGGENRGAMGGENLLMALGGCFMSNLLAVAKSRESDVTDVKLQRYVSRLEVLEFHGKPAWPEELGYVSNRFSANRGYSLKRGLVVNQPGRVKRK